MKPFVLLMAALFVTACTVSTNVANPVDKLAEIQARGTLVIATDADYTPQSKLVPGSSPAADTECKPTQYTADQFEGFDVEVAKELATHLGVEACFVTPPWSQLIAGNWGDNWDVHIGSVAITFDRMKNLYFSQPYYATPTVLLVHKDNRTYRAAEDLSGKRVGICAGCTFEDYLKGTLKIPGENIVYRIKNAHIVAYENEDPAIAALSKGDGVELDAVMTILPKARAAMEQGSPLRALDEPVVFAYASVTLDRASQRDPKRLFDEINRILQELHASGRLKELSVQYQGLDLTREAASYDISTLNQFTP
jgi:polar amino acid transport system substrate-binding protein